MIEHVLRVGGLLGSHERQWFRPESIIAVCRNGGRLHGYQPRFFVLYADPTQQFGCGRMPLDVKTFPQAVKAAEALGAKFLNRKFAGPQGVSEARIVKEHVGGLEVHGDAGFIVHVPRVQSWDRFSSLGTVEEFLRELPDGIALRFVELVEATEERWWRAWYDCTAIEKVKLAPSQYGDHAPSVYIHLHGAWHDLRTTDIVGVIAKIESAGVRTTCLRRPR